MARHSALAGVSFLAALSADGDGVHPECRVRKSSAFPVELPVVFSDSPGLRFARSGDGGGQPVAARNRYRHRSRQAVAASLGHDCAPDLCPGEIVLARMLFAWLERWLAQRRTREIMGILFFLFILSFQLIGPLIAVYEHRSIPETRQSGPGNVQRAAAPAAGACRGCDCGRGAGAAGRAGVLSFLLLGCYGIAFLWLLNFRLRAEYRGENLSESAGRKAVPGGLPAVRPGWNLPGLPGPVAAVFEKELRYLSRSGPMLFTLIVPLFMLAVFRSSGKNEGLFAHAPGLTFPLGAAYSLLLLTNLSYNNFGADGSGTQFFFASPVRFRQIMLGKNLAHAAVFAMEVVLVLAGNVLALSAAIDRRDAGHAGGHSVCRVPLISPREICSRSILPAGSRQECLADSGLP